MNSVPVTVATNTSDPGSIGIRVEHNAFANVLRGVAIQGFYGISTGISENTLSLASDNIYNSAQHGIDLSNSSSTGTLGAMAKIRANIATGSGTASSTYTQSLIYSSLNTAYASPSITCNELSESQQGFVFSGQNALTGTVIPGTRWFANEMESLGMGMLLDNNGRIGQQGNLSRGMGNHWNGTWTGTNYGIYTNTSAATQSPLYKVGTGTSSSPPNLFGAPFPLSYGTAGIFTTTTSAFQSCVEEMANIIPGTIDPQYGSANDAYISTTSLFRFLRYNETFRPERSTLGDFYSAINGSDNNIKLLVLAEEYLYSGNYNTARSLLSSLSATNTIEENYKNFYRLYANFQEAVAEEEDYGTDNTADLLALAQLCPATNGACIYQARALHNAIFSTGVNYPDCPAYREEGRPAGEQIEESQLYGTSLKAKNWDLELFPNPASSQLSIVGRYPNEILTVNVCDLSGRALLKQDIKSIGLIATLELTLVNGAYLISVSNSVNATTTKKLLIVK